MTTAAQDPMLTAGEVCARLRISDKTFRRLVRDGEIEAQKVGGGKWGGQYRISEQALSDYLKDNTVEVTA